MPFDERYIEQSERDEEARKQRAIAEARRDGQPDPVWIDGVSYCAECEAENTARARVGRGRCIDCQQRYELDRKRGLA